jgi:large subunit ribosomal protein L29
MPLKTMEIRNMLDSEIDQAVQDAKQELFNLRFQWASGQLEDYTRVRVLKKEIARLLTIKHERELAAELIQEEVDAE